MGDAAKAFTPSWKEYHLDNKAIADWIVWGGLTHESVLRQKDDSVLGVLSYRPYECGKERILSKLPGFQRGWSMQVEEQYDEEGAQRAFVVLVWNPFRNRSGEAENTLHGIPCPLDSMEDYLANVLETFAQAFPEEAEAHVLRYQEILDYLTFSLGHGRYHVDMPEVPVDLDVLLTLPFQPSFEDNFITLGEETYLVLSLPAMRGAKDATLSPILSEMARARFPCRHVQRLLFFSEEEAKKERDRADRMGNWCKSRQYIKERIEAPLLGKLYAYYTNVLVALVPTDKYESSVRYLRKYFYDAQDFYVIENFHAKQRWWGSIPGHFRANVRPPVVAFQSLAELLYLTGEAPEEKEEHLEEYTGAQAQDASEDTETQAEDD